MFDKRRLFQDQCGARVQISGSMWSESTNFRINVEREYKFHDQDGTRIQRRNHYQREVEITINFSRSNNVRINQMRDVEKMDENGR